MKRVWLIVLLVLLTFGLGARDRYESVSAGLIAHYKMNDHAIIHTVTDETGNHNGAYKDKDGNLVTSSCDVSGVIKRALDFDGGEPNEYVEIADHADLSPDGAPFSISLWINCDTLGFPIIRKGVISIDCEYCLSIAAYRNATHFCLYDKDDQTRYIGRGNGTTLSTGRWYYIVATYDGGILCSGVKVYVDSVEEGSEDKSQFDFAATDGDHAVWIGRGDYINGAPSSEYGDGKIDNVMFFNTELTPTQVSYLYNSGGGTETPDTREPRERY